MSQMMQSLGLNEGDPVRLTGAKLPKGKMVKIQAQSTDFLMVSDAKAVYISLPRCRKCLILLTASNRLSASTPL